MDEDNYAAQRGWICYEKPKNTIILYYSQSVPKMCIRYEASQHRGNSKDTMEKKQFIGARFSIIFFFFSSFNSLAVLGSQLVTEIQKWVLCGFTLGRIRNDVKESLDHQGSGLLAGITLLYRGVVPKVRIGGQEVLGSVLG